MTVKEKVLTILNRLTWIALHKGTVDDPRPTDKELEEAARNIVSIAGNHYLEKAAKCIEEKHTNNVGMVHHMAASDADAIRALKGPQ